MIVSLTDRANILTAPLSLILREEDVMKATNGMTLKEVFLNTDYLETVVIIISKWAFLFFSLHPLVRKRRSSCRATRSWAARKRSGKWWFRRARAAW